MKVSLNMNAVNQIPQGTVIYQKDEPLSSVCLLLKGRVLVQADGVSTVFSSGNFLGAWDIDYLTHSFTYTAKDDVVVYACPVRGGGDLDRLLDAKPEYRGLLNTSLNYFIVELNRTFERLQGACAQLKEFVLTQYKLYRETGAKRGIPVEEMSSIAPLERMKVGGVSLCKDLDYYLACAKMSIPAQKNYYEGSRLVSQVHFVQQKECLFSLLIECKRYTDFLMKCFRVLILDEKNLFGFIAKLTMELAHIGVSTTEIQKSIDEIVEKINDTEDFLVNRCGMNVELNRERMENIYYALISGESYEEKVSVTERKALSDLQNSLEQIMDYAPADLKDKKTEFAEAVKAFIALSDKYSRADDAILIRKTITKLFYEFYEAILLKNFQDQNPPVAVRLFLEFGYVSEELCEEKDLGELIELENHSDIPGGTHVYTMPQWLRAIYTMEKEPSKNEFDMDYSENLRYEKKTGIITDEQERYYLHSPKERVHFEIMNLFRYANRLLDGRVSVFAPILTSDSMLLPLRRAYLTSDRCKSAVNKVEQYDPLLFYREKRVGYEEVKVIKEDVLLKQYPDIIVFPVCGQNGMLWQDITGKDRNSKGRILFPQIMQGDVEQEMMKALAHFRWEKCRTEQGAQWNNLHYPSLTSEYTDYLQFYRKNMDLSAEARTKIKSQLTQAGSKHRDVFARDYMDWLTRESNGAMKLNRVARGILATYCPFPKVLRDKIMDQTVYSEAYKRFNRDLAKRRHDLEINCGKFKKAGETLPKELAFTKKFYDEF